MAFNFGRGTECINNEWYRFSMQEKYLTKIFLRRAEESHTSDISSCSVCWLDIEYFICSSSAVRHLQQVKTREALSCRARLCCLHLWPVSGEHLIKVSPFILLTQLKSAYEELLHKHLHVRDSAHIMLLCCGGWVESFAGSELCFLWHRCPPGQSLFIRELTASPWHRKLRSWIPPDHHYSASAFMKCSWMIYLVM